MKNLFERTSSNWVRYSEYERRAAEDGTLYLTPTKTAQPSIYDPLSEYQRIVLDAINIGRMGMSKKSDAEFPFDKCKREELKPMFHSTHSSFFVTLKNMNFSSQSLSDQDGDQDTDQVVTKMLLEFCVEPRSKREICAHLGFHNLTYFTRTYLNPLLETGKLLRTIPDKPSSKNQKYVRS